MIAVVPGGAMCLMFLLHGQQTIIIIIAITVSSTTTYVPASLSLHIVPYARNSSFTACLDSWQGVVEVKMNWFQLMKVVVVEEIPLLFLICCYFFKCGTMRSKGNREKTYYKQIKAALSLKLVRWTEIGHGLIFLEYQIIVCLFFFFLTILGKNSSLRCCWSSSRRTTLLVVYLSFLFFFFILWRLDQSSSWRIIVFFLAWCHNWTACASS